MQAQDYYDQVDRELLWRRLLRECNAGDAMVDLILALFDANRSRVLVRGRETGVACYKGHSSARCCTQPGLMGWG